MRWTEAEDLRPGDFLVTETGTLENLMVDLDNVSWPNLFGPIAAVDTVLVPGYVDDDTGRRTVARGYPSRVALGRDGVFVEFATDGYSGQLTFQVKDDIEIPEEIVEDPSLKPLYIDITWLFVREPIPRRLESITLYLNEESDLSERRVRAASATLEGGGVLALDPFSFSGMEIGSATLRDEIEQNVMSSPDGRRAVIRP